MFSEWSHQTHSGQPKQHQCCQTDGKKLCYKGIYYQPASWNFQYQYKTSELVVQTLLINTNYWKRFNKYIYVGLFRRRWWKMNRVTSRLMEKKRRFCTSLYISGTWGNVAGFIYERKVKGECILNHFEKNYSIFNYFCQTRSVTWKLAFFGESFLMYLFMTCSSPGLIQRDQWHCMMTNFTGTSG